MTGNNSKKYGVLLDGRIVLAIILILICSLCLNVYSLYRVRTVETQITEVKDNVDQFKDSTDQVLSILKEIREVQQKQNETITKITNNKKEAKSNIILLKNTGMDTSTDLGQRINISPEVMDQIIDYYDSHVAGGTRFKGKGKTFVQAAKESGLNPIYIFAHAAVESAYGNSYLAVTRNNYFGINAVDTNPDLASAMGDDVDQGIINGAKWIASNFYNNGYTTLDDMQAGGYATNQEWKYKIKSVMNTSLSIVEI